MRKYLNLLPLLFVFAVGNVSAVELPAPLGLTTQFPDLNTGDLDINYDAGSGLISLENGDSSTAQLTAFDGDLGTLYMPGSFTYKLSGNVNNLPAIDFSASTSDDNAVNLTGTVVSFGAGNGVLEFLVDIASTGTVNFGNTLGIIISNVTSNSAQADSFAVPVPAAVWLFMTGLLGLVSRKAKHIA